jgi:hypothetical protein
LKVPQKQTKKIWKFLKNKKKIENKFLKASVPRDPIFSQVCWQKEKGFQPQLFMLRYKRHCFHVELKLTILEQHGIP